MQNARLSPKHTNKPNQRTEPNYRQFAVGSPRAVASHTNDFKDPGCVFVTLPRPSWQTLGIERCLFGRYSHAVFT
jgi:hypothetical protein